MGKQAGSALAFVLFFVFAVSAMAGGYAKASHVVEASLQFGIICDTPSSDKTESYSHNRCEFCASVHKSDIDSVAPSSHGVSIVFPAALMVSATVPSGDAPPRHYATHEKRLNPSNAPPTLS